MHPTINLRKLTLIRTFQTSRIRKETHQTRRTQLVSAMRMPLEHAGSRANQERPEHTAVAETLSPVRRSSECDDRGSLTPPKATTRWMHARPKRLYCTEKRKAHVEGGNLRALETLLVSVVKIALPGKSSSRMLPQCISLAPGMCLSSIMSCQQPATSPALTTLSDGRRLLSATDGAPAEPAKAAAATTHEAHGFSAGPKTKSAAKHRLPRRLECAAHRATSTAIAACTHSGEGNRINCAAEVAEDSAALYKCKSAQSVSILLCVA